MKRVQLLLLLLSLYLSIMGCSESNDVTNSSDRKSARPPVAVEIAQAEFGTMVEGIDVTGTLAPKFEVDVKSEIVGTVYSVNVNEWIRVKKGTTLARIDAREQTAIVKRAEATLESAKASAMQAKVAANRAERERERMRKLKEVGLATQQGVDDAETEAAAASSRIDAANAQVRSAREELLQAGIRLSKGIITAPIDGIVSMRRVNVGDLVGEAGVDKPLFHIVDNRILNLTVSVPSSEMSRIRLGQQVQFMTDALPGKTFIGKVMFINPSVNELDRALKINAEVRNASEELKGGLFVKGRIIMGTRQNVVKVPRTALIGWDVAGKKAKLYVVESDLARLREVKIGAVMQDKVEIMEGLKKEESYVLRGGFNVKDGDRLIVAKQKQGS
jgi:membrane fusion protein (multidrug efflux system)